jgi:hypothetical protein
VQYLAHEHGLKTRATKSRMADSHQTCDIDRATKAAWTLLVVLIPLAGVFAYLIANGEGMARRKAEGKRTR